MKTVSKLLEQAEKNKLVWGLWNWNGRISLELITEQFRQLVSAGFNGIMVRPQENIIPAYLSEEFVGLFNALLEMAAKEDVAIMIADDFSSFPPSSFLQGLTANKGFRANRLVLNKSTDMEGGDHFEFTPDPRRQEYVIASPLSSSRKISLDGTKILFDGDENTKQSWTATKGTWRVLHLVVENVRTDAGEYSPNFFSTKCAQGYTSTVLDTLIPGKAPASFNGVLCEMPSVIPSSAGIPWDDELFVPKYRSRFKRNLVETVPALFSATVDSDSKYRPHILNFIHDTFFERFSSTCNKWAQSKKVDLWFIGAETDQDDHQNSGHFLYSQASDSFAVTGIRNDTSSLSGDIALMAMADGNKDTKNCDTAVVLGRNCHMKNISLAELKYAGEKALFNGANKLVIDGIFTNQEYHFSRTTPQGLGFHHPDFDKLPQLLQFFKNSSEVLKCGIKETTRTAILFPSQSAIADFNSTGSEVLNNVAQEVENIVATLRTKQLPFTIVSENSLSECKVDAEGTITNSASGEKYNTIIVPYSRLINNSVFVQLEKFAVKKGTLLFINEAPKGSFDDGISSSFLTRIEKLIKSRTKRVFVTTVSEMIGKITEEEIPSAVSFSEDAENLCVIESEFEDLAFITVRNSSDSPVGCLTSHIDEHRYYQLDMVNGKLLKVDESDPHDTAEEFPFYVQPHSSVTLVATGGSIGNVKKGILAHDAPDYRIKIRNDRWQFKALSLNSFPLTRWNTRMSIDRNSGLLSNYYETSFELDRTEIESYIIFSDARAKESTGINARFKVLLNGHELASTPERVSSPETPDSYIDNDSQILVYPIKDFLQRGRNTIRVMKNCTGYTPDPLSFPPSVLIDAPVEQTAKGWKVVKLPDENAFNWGESGYPYLVGTGQYTISFEVPDGYEQVLLNFENLSGSAELAINGEIVSTLLWAPYRVDVTDFVSDKRNELTVTVKNNLSAVTQLNGKESGIIGDVYLEVFGMSRDAPEDE